MRREQELEEVQLVPCASSHGLVSSFPWVFLLSLFNFISISKSYAFPARYHVIPSLSLPTFG